jgi:hypothetical protein
MYMDILEQEVEALSAEVTRLRLMVHRITQVMEAPSPQRQNHVDPLLNATPSPSLPSGDGTPVNLQATVDSYKQILPLIQLLLEQQQQQKQQRAKASSAHRDAGNEGKTRGTKSSHRGQHHRSHRRRSRRSLSSSTTTTSFTNSKSASTPASATSSEGTSCHPPTSSPSSSRAHSTHEDRHESTKSKEASEAPPPSTSASATRRQKQSAVAIEVTPMREEQHRHPPAATPKSGSIVDRLRAQRGLTGRDDDDGSSPSTNSSDVMPMIKSQTRSAATSPSAAGQRPSPAAGGGTTPMSSEAATTPVVLAKTSDASLTATTNAKLTHRRASGNVVKHLAESLRSASVPAEDLGYYEFSPAFSMLDAPHDASDASSPLRSDKGGQHAAKLSSAHRGRSTVNSLEYSEQGQYCYSVLGSLANSPAMSHVPDDAARSARTGTPTATSAALEQSSPLRSHKQLPLQTSVLSRAQETSFDNNSSSSSGSSESRTSGNVAPTPLVLAASPATRAFGASVVLGARQPISAHASISTPPTAFPHATHVASSSMKGSSAAAVGGAVDKRPNLLGTLHPMKSRSSSSGSDSSSSSDAAAAVFQRQQAHQASKEDHRESSFHNYSDATSSPPTSNNNAPLQPHGYRSPQQSQSSPPRQQDFSATLSQDAYSFAAYSAQYSAQGSPQQGDAENEASTMLSRVMSHSVSRPQTALSESHGAASSGGRRGSLASGGYYYGYDFGAGSPCQQSEVSNGGVERRTASSTPVYDY